MLIFSYVMFFVVGLCCGSFVNMLLYRTARRYGLEKKKILKRVRDDKRSFCDFCGKQLKWYENVPVVSWVIQGGRSKCCGKKLPASYPLVELGMGVILVITNNQITSFPNNYQLSITNYQTLLTTALSLVMVVLLVFSAVFDAKYMILPDFSTYILIVIAVLGLVLDEKNILSYLLAAAGGSGFLGLVYLLTKGGGMGLGDVKLAVFMGLLLGWPKIIVAFYAAFISGAIWGGWKMVRKKMGRGAIMPFGPFLIWGTVTVWMWGENIIKFIILNFNF